MKAFNWAGVFPALTTKFDAQDALDFPAMAKHLDWQLSCGVHGIIILGSLGENATLEAKEKRDLVAFFSQEINGRVPLVACIAESSTRRACALAADAQRLGADGLMVLPPMRYPSDTAETMQYFRDVAAASDLPIMLYNNPVAYGTDITPEDFALLADNPLFVAIKESSADTRRISELRRLLGERYALFCGVDDLAFESYTLGAVGWVAGLVVAFPAETLRLWALLQAGRWDEARTLYEWFLPLLHLDIGPRFVQQIKLVEEMMGVGSARVRAPRQALSEQRVAEVRQVLDHALATRP